MVAEVSDVKTVSISENNTFILKNPTFIHYAEIQTRESIVEIILSSRVSFLWHLFPLLGTAEKAGNGYAPGCFVVSGWRVKYWMSPSLPGWHFPAAWARQVTSSAFPSLLMIQQMKVNLSFSLGCSNCASVPQPLLSSHVSSRVYSSRIKIRTARVYCALPVGLFLEFLSQEFLNICSFQPHGNPQRQTLLSCPFDRRENRGIAVILDELLWGLPAAAGVSPEPTPFAERRVGRWVLAQGRDLGNWRVWTRFQCQPCGNQLRASRAPCRLSRPLPASWKWGWVRYSTHLGGGTIIKDGAVGKTLPASAGDPGDVGSLLGWGRSPGEGNSNPLQYSCLENSMDRGAWWATARGISGSRTWLSNWAHGIWARSDSFKKLRGREGVNWETVTDKYTLLNIK